MTKIDFCKNLKVSKISIMRLKWGIELLPDTKLTKNIIQLILIRDLPGDLTQVMQAAADIQGQQVAGEVVVETGFDIVQ